MALPSPLRGGWTAASSGWPGGVIAAVSGLYLPHPPRFARRPPLEEARKHRLRRSDPPRGRRRPEHAARHTRPSPPCGVERFSRSHLIEPARSTAYAIFSSAGRPFGQQMRQFPHSRSQQLACGNGWPQPPLRQVWRWSAARWVARGAPVPCRPVRSRLSALLGQPMGREPAGEKTPAAHGSASTLYFEDVAAVRRFPHPGLSNRRGNNAARPLLQKSRMAMAS